MPSRASTNDRAMGCIGVGSPAGTSSAQSTSSSRVMAVASARPSSPMRGARAAGDRRVPSQSGQTCSERNRLTLAKRFSLSARLSSSVTVRRALRNVKSRSCSPFFEVTVMCFFSSGPLNTMSRSQPSRSRQGTSVRTPNSRAICGWTLKPNICQGMTVPSSIDISGSRMREASSTSLIVPMPSQRGQAPPELKASSSAPGA